MRFRFSALALLLALVSLALPARAAASLEALARQAVSENKTEADAALAQLRAAGPAGLDALFRANEAEIKRHLEMEAALDAGPQTEWQRLAAALDAVAQQRDSYAAHLYWYTDLAQAQAVAAQTGKPILSLRLLGRLTDEFSCANSRFFRAALYPNAQVSQYLREHFILHWSSERPAPRITVDFGDGRVIERTITGNSIHYVLDAQGRPLDALPGLYGPQAFLRALSDAEKLAHQLAGQSDEARVLALQAYHRNRVTATNNAWAADLRRAGVNIERASAPAKAASPTAATAAPLAVTKRAVEIPLVLQVNPDPRNLGAITDEAAWQKIAALHAADVQLDDHSRAVMARHLPPLTVNRKLSPEGRLYVMMQRFQELMALDTVRNEYSLRPRLHSWFAGGQVGTWEDLNRRVYAELFLTPRTDDWLGLFGPDTYTGLENGGVRP